MDRLYREQIIRIIVIIAGVIGFIAAVITLISFWPIIYKFLCSIPILSLCPLCPKPTINILDCPSSVYGGEELNVRVSWNNTPTGWKLVVSLQESETNFTRLAESDASKIVSDSGNDTFKLKVKPTTEVHDQVKVCACFYKGTKQKNVFEKKNVTVYPNEVSIFDYSPSPVHGGEELNVKVRWNNIPIDWKLDVSLQESETDYTRLAESSGSKIDSSSGNETFKLKVYPTTQIHDQAKICAYFYEGPEQKNVFDKKDVTVYPTRVSIFDCSPSPVHGGEKLSANISWNNIPTDWTLYVSLEESETDHTPLACGGPSKIDSSSGNETFKLEVYPTEKDHDQAKVCARAHFFDGTEWKNVFDKKDIKVYRTRAIVNIPGYSPSSEVHGGQELNVNISWNNVPVDWELRVSLEESETDHTPLAYGGSGFKIESSSGEKTFRLEVKPTTGIHEQAKICACFYEGTEWKNVFDKKDIKVLP